MDNATRTLKLLILPACIALVAGIEASFAIGSETAPSLSGTINTVAVIADTALGEPAQYGLRKLEAALRAKAIEVSEGEDQVNKSDLVLLFGLANRRGAAAAALEEMKTPAPSGAEALTVRINARYHQNPAVVVTGSDDTGLMYAALDLADRVGRTGSGENPFRFAQDVDEQPYLKERGVVMFTMNRVFREPSVRRAVLGTLFRHVVEGPFQSTRFDIRLRGWRLHGAAVSLLL